LHHNIGSPCFTKVAFHTVTTLSHVLRLAICWH
jgi:hypothetical protein